MKLLAFALALPVLQLSAAHSIFTTLFVDNINQGDGTCVRMNMTPDNSTSPVIDIASNDMACGYDGSVGVARVCPVSQGAKLTFLWREWADTSHPGSIDASHKGPCAVYMKAVSSALIDPGYGTGWFKIWDSGYDNTISQWCTEKLIQNNGLFSVDIPNDIAGGYYLVRPELLALHQADKSPPNPQFYVGCAQIFLQSTGISLPQDTVSIPGYVDAADASVRFNIYTPKWPYPMPGPAPYEGSSGIRGDAKVSASSPEVQKEGLVPNGCVLSNANWCGIELDTYTTEAGCWNASAACFQQDTLCYSSSPPTGSKNCAIWEGKCDSIQAACNAGNFNGPPDHGKDLNPASTIGYSIPPVAAENREVYSLASSFFDFTSSSSSMSMPPLDTTTLISVVTDTFTQSPSGSILPVVDVSNSFLQLTTRTSMASLTTTSSIIGEDPNSASTSTMMNPSTSGNPTNTQSAPLPTTTDATCGLTSNHSCLGSSWGSCCSQWNWCGITDAYCGNGCQPGYGTCWAPFPIKEKSAHLKRHHGH